MNIVMFTNTYTPHVGGVARSVEAFAASYRSRGHRVLVVAPEFPDMPENEADVVRVPAIQNFNGSDFSVVLPVSGLLTEVLDDFQPDIIHSHHPYLLGVTALRVARFRHLPLVFTHHTRYEDYTHYVPGNAPMLRRFIIEVAVRYSNLADQVFAPSESIADLLRERGVESEIEVVPTGVDLDQFREGDGMDFRTRSGIPADAFVTGHLGRLAPEKNIEFLSESIAAFLQADSRAHCLIAGVGPAEQTLREVFERQGLTARLHFAGLLKQPQLSDSLHAMDVFAFASRSETQGMVLTEAMAAGVPVVALDAPGAREVVRDGINGRLLMHESVSEFADALRWVAQQPEAQRLELRQAAYRTAESFSMENMAERALSCYARMHAQTSADQAAQDQNWHQLLNLVKVEWEILKGIGSATESALVERDEPK